MSTQTTGGVSTGLVIFLVLLILKIAGLITMHWGWVITSFIWAPVLIVIGILLIVFAVGTIGAVLSAIFS